MNHDKPNNQPRIDFVHVGEIDAARLCAALNKRFSVGKEKWRIMNPMQDGTCTPPECGHYLALTAPTDESFNQRAMEFVEEWQKRKHPSELAGNPDAAWLDEAARLQDKLAARAERAIRFFGPPTTSVRE